MFSQKCFKALRAISDISGSGADDPEDADGGHGRTDARADETTPADVASAAGCLE